MNISYEQIRAFVAVAETGSFSAAARYLNKHRTTLGQVVSNLEIEVNMTLFDRSGKYPILTEHGQTLLLHAKNLNNSTTAFENLCLTIESGIESDITIYHTDLLPTSMIATVMKDIRIDFPHVNVHWLNRTANETRSSLQTGDADLGIVMLDARSQGASITDYVYLMSMPFKVVASSEAFSENGTRLSTRDLKSSRQLILEDNYLSLLRRTLVVSSKLQRVEDINVLKALLRNDEGWAVVPAHTVKQEIESGVLIDLNIEELNTQLRFPLAIWYMNQSQSGPIRSRIIESLCHHSGQYEGGRCK